MPSIPSPSTGKAARDADRIAAELVGMAGDNDPFVAAVRATRMPMIITDPRQNDNPVVFANDAFCRLTGYGRDEILGRNCRFLQGADTDRAAVALIGEAVAQLRSIEIDIRNYRKTGETFWNRLFLAPVYDADGVLAYFFASQMDVTLERERLEKLELDKAALTAELAGRLEEQRERENELRFTLEAGRLGAWTLDAASHDLTASAAFRENFGRRPDEAFGYAAMRAAIAPEDRAGVEEALAHSLASGHTYEVEFRCTTPAGDTRWVSLRGRPILDASGHVLRISGISRDLTEQKRADRLRQALADLGSVFRSSQKTAELSFQCGRILGDALGISRAGFGQIDGDTGVLFVERDWRTEGVPSVAGQPRPLAQHGTYIEQLQRGQTVVIRDVRSDPRTAGALPALRAISVGAFINVPVFDRGRLAGLLFVVQAAPRDWRDDEILFMQEAAERTRAAVERRLAEQSASQLAVSLEQQVAQRTQELMTAEEALRQSQKMEAIGQLTGGVAHDFNNLLTVIRSSVDLMRRPNLPEDRRRRYIDAISDTVNRAAKLTGQLLAFARRQALNPEVFDLRERLIGLADMIDAVTGTRIRVMAHLPDAACFIRADISQFETALVNMAVNARDAMSGEGVLTLRLQQVEAMPPIRGHAGSTGRFAAVSIADTGEGIPNDDLIRIFEPFFTTKGVGKGTGLGLSQVFGFAKQSGGDVDVHSQHGRGAIFTLYLPQIESAGAERNEAASRAEFAMGGGGRRVLLVEDNVEVGRFSSQVLQDLGYHTVWAVTAADALTKLRNGEEFDVVFSDVVMPGISGIELAKQLRNTHPNLPIVLTSGYSHVLAEEGAHGFELLHKPYSAEQLSGVLRRAAGRRRIVEV